MTTLSNHLLQRARELRAKTGPTVELATPQDDYRKRGAAIGARIRRKPAKEMSAKDRALVEFLFRRREEQERSTGSRLASAAGLATGAAAGYGIASYLRGARMNAAQRPRTMAKLPLLEKVGANVATGHRANVDTVKGAVSGLLKRVQGLRRFAQEDGEVAQRLVEFSRSRRGL